jgi:hypothetical protein
MSTQLQNIRTEILEEAGLAADDARFPDATMNRMINSALREISSEAHWPWNEASETINTVATTTSYTPAAAWQSTKRLSYLNRDLIEFQPQDAVQYSQDNGSPQGFYIEADKLVMVPVPDGAYALTHIYSAVETALSGDTDTPALPDRYISWLVNVALIKVAKRLRDTDLYSIADRERRLWRTRAHDESRRSIGTLHPKVRNDWSV